MVEYEAERARAVARIVAAGYDPRDFTFAMEYLPPDPDDGAMFTIRYAVTATRAANRKAQTFIGGIEFDWPSAFDEALKTGHFD